MVSVRLLAFWLICGVSASVLYLQIRQQQGAILRLGSWAGAGADAAAVDASNNVTTIVIEEDDDDDDDISTLPAALRPSNFTRCCTKMTTNPKHVNNPYKATCHTEQACQENSLYPFHSEDEKQFLEKYQRGPAEKAKHKKICQEAVKELNPEVTWCKIKVRDSNNANNHSIPQSFYPTGCSNHGMGGGSGPYDRLLLFPTYKLAFCGIPKSGITRWIQFLRFVNGARDYQDSPYYKLDTMPFYFDMLHPDRHFEIWNDPNWTRAVLIREPTERLLSGFLDKITSHKQVNFTTLEQFVDFLERFPPEVNKGSLNSGLSWYTDPHWRPQAYSCGMVQMLPSLHYVGGLDRVAEHTRSILERVGLWKSHGRHYCLSRRTKAYPVQNPPPDVSKVNTTGFQQSPVSRDHHSRGAQSKIDKYFTPELLARVQKLYWMDYALWDALQQAGPGPHHGKDIAAILNPSECFRGQQLFDADSQVGKTNN